MKFRITAEQSATPARTAFSTTKSAVLETTKPRTPSALRKRRGIREKCKVLVYRIQPAGKDLGGHRSETSNGEPDKGVHVCSSLSELAGAILGWMEWRGSKPELVTIKCEAKDVLENGDYEGSVLVANKGAIVERKTFQNSQQLIEWAKANA